LYEQRQIFAVKIDDHKKDERNWPYKCWKSYA